MMILLSVQYRMKDKQLSLPLECPLPFPCPFLGQGGREKKAPADKDGLDDDLDAYFAKKGGAAEE